MADRSRPPRLPGQLLRKAGVRRLGGLCEHLKTAEKQGTSARSRFLDACRRANAGKLTEDALIEEAVRRGFNNVIDAFHVLSNGELAQRFFIDERQPNRGIRATDTFAKVVEGAQASNLPEETEARWRLVETAWELGVSRALVTVRHDPATEALFVLDPAQRRRSVTGARSALSGYQKGHCFYCFDTFSLVSDNPPDVDHFFPHALKTADFSGIIDGVWNLVLACQRCNRGAHGKFDRVPSLRLLERLHARNEFLIASHHPLRETLMAQTGNTEVDRRDFLNTTHRRALAARIADWNPIEVRDRLF